MKDLNADLVGLGRSNFDVLNGERLSGAPGNRSLQKFIGILDGGGHCSSGFLTLQVMV